MQFDEIQNTLRQDFDNLAAYRETDPFAQRLLAKLNHKRRARLGVIGFTAGIGAAFAASQFAGFVTALSGVYATPIATADAYAFVPNLIAGLVIGGALLSTAIILRREV